MFAIVVEYLNRHREIGVCGKIRGAYDLEARQQIDICIRICPTADKLIIVHEEVNALALRQLAASGVVKADEAVSVATIKGYRLKGWNAVDTRTVKYAPVQVLIIASLSVHGHPPPFISELSPRRREDDAGGGGPSRRQLSRRQAVAASVCSQIHFAIVSDKKRNERT